MLVARVRLARTDFLQWINVLGMIYSLTILPTKASILLLYLRMFSVSRIIRAIIHINLWANIMFYIACFFLQLLQSMPREAIWNPWFEGARCVNMQQVRLFSAVLNAVSDFAILILPISTVRKLNLKRKKKMALVAVFATGLL